MAGMGKRVGRERSGVVGLSPVRTDTPLFVEHPSAGHVGLYFCLPCSHKSRDDPPRTGKEPSLEWFDGSHLQPSIHETHSS